MVLKNNLQLATDTPDFFWKEEKFEMDYKMVRVSAVLPSALVSDASVALCR